VQSFRDLIALAGVDSGAKMKMLSRCVTPRCSSNGRASTLWSSAGVNRRFCGHEHDGDTR
jgi:hypothetical protein